MSAASPEFYQPCAPPAYSPGRLRVAASEPSANGEDYRCRTPTGVSYLGEPLSCPPAPMKPREPPASACRRRLFDVKVIRLRFDDDLEAIDRPSFLRNGKRRPGKISGGSRRSTMLS
ncbi:hypothetical protein QYE76_071776 [Lolium multiflorum]|uniref:Uncharacterized protein n=1 Tax=Lolium multiflorum TaxID=4521 RepID=A0AAD8WEW9_LOLMU|nr:hypothetical protein QYE76_071776 [Lolium multiflorum]